MTITASARYTARTVAEPGMLLLFSVNGPADKVVPVVAADDGIASIDFSLPRPGEYTLTFWRHGTVIDQLVFER